MFSLKKSEKQKCLEVPFRACPGLISGGFRGNLVVCGNSSVGRALASQAEGRGFEPRLPLKPGREVYPDIYREAPFADPLKNDLYNKYLIST